ncbi:MAG: 30S ribosomal protein S4 [Nanoarchaeota archaeon]|nr:30S ribosomal protein S4 [Nanoarchaeota archaeon]MBU0962872.1 30S ribosomal protein S4 [Nanoarchaeota archaeon]
MGHPKKLKKKYKTPSHPWERARIEKEGKIKKVYGLKNKKEIWKAKAKIKNFTKQAKRVIAKKTEQNKKEEKQLMEKLDKLNLIDKNDKIENVLNLTIENLLDRRLQTVVLRLGLARSIKQSRQFIKHGHIFVSGKKMTIPSYIITKNDKIIYNPKSTISNPDHPERLKEKVEIKKEKIKEPGVEEIVQNE